MDHKWLGVSEFPTLETLRLLLREISDADFPLFHSLFKDAKVNENIRMNWGEPIEAKKIFDSFRSRFHEGKGVRWSIVLKETGEWVGNFGFHNPRPEAGCVERGLQIVSSRWRSGYGSEASRAAMEWLTARTPYRTVDAWIAEGNSPARRLVEKQGFRDTGDRKPSGALTVARYAVSF